jgi:hypothetical protein
MEKSIKEVSNQELIELYKLIVNHQEYLNTELDKVKEDEKND